MTLRSLVFLLLPQVLQLCQLARAIRVDSDMPLNLSEFGSSNVSQDYRSYGALAGEAGWGRVVNIGASSQKRKCVKVEEGWGWRRLDCPQVINEPWMRQDTAAAGEADNQWWIEIEQDRSIPYGEESLYVYVCATLRFPVNTFSWKSDLQVSCSPDQRPATPKPENDYNQVVNIGSFQAHNEKCVVVYAYPVQCSSDAANAGKRLGWGHAPDTFDIRVTMDERHHLVCARRTDINSGWGMDLKFTCSLNGEDYLVSVGDHNVYQEKCVSDRRWAGIECDEDAGNPGRRLGGDHYGDTFEIRSYTQGGNGEGTVCARRTNSQDAGWGLDLKVNCMVRV
mmetsp:Transcript_44470/g.81200  ORF Transcript_44470/g.81200 Transcript_44470/m.81200 type:complete len:337 (-) Transcript_44470:119-1129(-)